MRHWPISLSRGIWKVFVAYPRVSGSIRGVKT